MIFQNPFKTMMKSRQHQADEPTEVKFFGDFNKKVQHKKVYSNLSKMKVKEKTYKCIKAAYDGKTYKNKGKTIENGICVIHDYEHPILVRCDHRDRRNIKEINNSFMTDAQHGMGYGKIKNSLNINSNNMTEKYGYAIELAIIKAYERMKKYDDDNMYKVVTSVETMIIDNVSKRITRMIGSYMIEKFDQTFNEVTCDIINWNSLKNLSCYDDNYNNYWNMIRYYVNSYKEYETDEIYISNDGIMICRKGSIIKYSILDTSCVDATYRIADLQYDTNIATTIQNEIFWCENFVDMQVGYEKRINLGTIYSKSIRTEIVLNRNDRKILERFRQYSSAHSYLHMKFTTWNQKVESLHSAYLSNILTYRIDNNLYILPRRGEITIPSFSAVEWLDKIEPRANTISKIMTTTAGRDFNNYKYNSNDSKGNIYIKNIFWLTNEIDSEYNIDLKEKTVPLNFLYITREYCNDAANYCWIPRRPITKLDPLMMRSIHSDIKCGIEGSKILVPIEGIIERNNIQFADRESEMNSKEASHYVVIRDSIKNREGNLVVGLIKNGTDWHYINPAIVHIKEYIKTYETIKIGSLIVNYTRSKINKIRGEVEQLAHEQLIDHDYCSECRLCSHCDQAQNQHYIWIPRRLLQLPYMVVTTLGKRKTCLNKKIKRNINQV